MSDKNRFVNWHTFHSLPALRCHQSTLCGTDSLNVELAHAVIAIDGC